MTLDQLLLRALSGSPTRAFRSVDRGAVFFGTDVGLRRNENQDRVAVVRWRAKLESNLGSMMAIVVSDGMGGMQDGAFCAAKTISVFVAELMNSHQFDLTRSIMAAVHAANASVYDAYRGKGGATLSAVVISEEGKVTGVNVGDSRIYAPVVGEPRELARRLTIDDTMKEAFGSEGNDLLQFVGLGPGLQPHVVPVEQSANILAITTDGAHFIESKIFSEVLARSPDPKAMVERVIALSRWLGAPDNATIAVIDIERAIESTRATAAEPAEFWPGGSEGPMYIVERPAAVHVTDVVAPYRAEPNPIEVPRSQPVRQAKAVRKKKATNRSPSDQLTIDVEVTRDPATDVNS